MVETLPKTDPIEALMKALADSLNQAEFQMEFTADFGYATDWNREAESLQVFVMPKREDALLQDRLGTTLDTYTVQVGFQMECLPDNTELIGQLMGLVREVKDYVKENGSTILPGLPWIGYEHDPIYDQDHLLQQHQFRTAPEFLFRGERYI